jgi:CDP-diacylglycerol--glycerol-3-phosphate 3-phosphatidyltransferase
MNLPNILTLSRITMIPVFVVIFYLPAQWSYFVSATIFALAAAIDWLDGYLARRLDQSTPFGAFLDPVADKLMVAVALTVLIEAHSSFILTIPPQLLSVVRSSSQLCVSGWPKSAAAPALRCPTSARSKPPHR